MPVRIKTNPSQPTPPKNRLKALVTKGCSGMGWQRFPWKRSVGNAQHQHHRPAVRSGSIMRNTIVGSSGGRFQKTRATA